MGRGRSSSSGRSSGGSSFGFGRGSSSTTKTQPSRGYSTAAPAPTTTRTRDHGSSQPKTNMAPLGSAAPATSASAAAPAAASGSSSMLGSFGSTIMQGMAFGGGSEIARRGIDGVMGGRTQTVVHEHQGGPEDSTAPMSLNSNPSSMSAAGGAASTFQSAQECQPEVGQFQQCLTQNQGSMQMCDFWFNALAQCQKSNKENQQFNMA